MKPFKKKSRLLYVSLACALVLSTVTPDRYTNQVRAELASITCLSTSWGWVGSILTNNIYSIGSTLLCALGAWGISRSTHATTTTPSRDPQTTTVDYALQGNLLSIGTEERITEPLLDQTQSVIDSVIPLTTCNATDFSLKPAPTDLPFHFDSQSLPNQQPRSFGIKQNLTGDPLWAMLSLQEKIYISESPLQQATWNTYLTLRRHSFEQVVTTLGLSKKQITYPIKKIIYDALSKGGTFFSPLEQPDIVVAAIQEASISTKEKEKIFSLLFAKNGMLTAISGAPYLENFTVSSTIFDPKYSNLLIGLNQLGQFLQSTQSDIACYEITCLTSLLHDALKKTPYHDYNTIESLFTRGCNALIKNECRVVLKLPELTKRRFIRDKISTKRSTCQRDILQAIDQCLLIIDGLILTPELQQRVEAALADLIAGSHYAKKLMDEGSYDHARRYMAHRVEYVTASLKAIIQSVGGHAVYSTAEQEYLEHSDAAALEAIEEMITQNPEQDAYAVLQEIFEKPFLLKKRYNNKQKKQKKQSHQKNQSGNQDKKNNSSNPLDADKQENIKKLAGRTWDDREVPSDRETILKDPKFQKTNYRNKGATVYKYNKRYYCRDTQHYGDGAHLEVFDKQGRHTGEADPLTGEINFSKADPSKKPLKL